MTRKDRTVIVASVMLGLVTHTQIAHADPVDSFSEATSKHKHRFICEIDVTPAHFSWRNHDVAVAEAWLEQRHSAPGNQVLIIKFSIDGSTTNESHVDDEEHLDLKPENGDVFSSGTQTRVPARSLMIGAKYGDTIHVVSLKNGLTSPLMLTVLDWNHSTLPRPIGITLTCVSKRTQEDSEQHAEPLQTLT